MAKIIELISKRRSVRMYKDEALTKEQIHLILEAARLSPTARNLQELRYKVVTDRKIMAGLSDGIKAVVKKQHPNLPLRDRPMFYDAPLLIVITGPRDNDWRETDAALAVQNIMLQATEMGLGSCFIGMAKFIDADPALENIINISKDHCVAAAVICGHPAEQPDAKDKKMDAEFFG